MDSFSKTACRGYTLIEVLVALFVFLIIMTELSQTFTQSFASYKRTKAVQRDVANSQFALNLMAKELRTSSIVSSTASKVKFYDYSQGECIEYRINASALQVAKAAAVDLADCVATTLGSYDAVTTGTVTGGFVVTPSSDVSGSKVVGKITVSLEISEGPDHTASIQTTSSLRDYGYVGL